MRLLIVVDFCTIEWGEFNLELQLKLSKTLVESLVMVVVVVENKLHRWNQKRLDKEKGLELTLRRLCRLASLP